MLPGQTGIHPLVTGLEAAGNRRSRRETLQATMDTASVQYEHKLYRPSRMIYPGSRFGPKTRYDLPQRHKEGSLLAYGNASELEAIIFNGTSLQPEVWSSGHGGAKTSGVGQGGTSSQGAGSSARGPQEEESQVLKIPPVASLADVTEAYHQQALRWLPEYELEDPEVVRTLAAVELDL
eukprot:Skav213366  [mRNA]  locus=scaffold317:427604:431334:- [translate_table: standard]